MALAVLIWLTCGIASAFMMKEKNRSGCGGFVIGVLLGPIGVLLAALAENRGKNKDKLASCPACANEVSKEADFCPDCGQPLSENYDEDNQSDKMVECKKCHEQYNENLDWCPHCGSKYTVSNPKKS